MTDPPELEWRECLNCEGAEGYYDIEDEEWIDCFFCEGNGGHWEEASPDRAGQEQK
jgi:hypothetical protein